jgi:transcriptional regulator
MYQPPHFREDRLEVQHGLIRAHPLGLLVSAGSRGLVANLVPFLLDHAASALGTLLCHVARANDQWRELQTASECLVVFQGPQDYVTPSWLASKRETGKVVPTWNYATVMAWGAPRVTDDQEWLRRQISALTESREASRTAPWSVGDAPPEYVAAQMKGIVGIEIPIYRIEGKWKMSQNRSESDRAGIVAGFREQGGDQSLEIADLVTERGRVEKRTDYDN